MKLHVQTDHRQKTTSSLSIYFAFLLWLGLVWGVMLRVAGGQEPRPGDPGAPPELPANAPHVVQPPVDRPPWGVEVEAGEAQGEAEAEAAAEDEGEALFGQAPGEEELEAVEAAAARPAEQPEDNGASRAVLDDYTALARTMIGEEREETEIRSYHCRHIDSNSLSRVLAEFISPSGNVADNPQANIVVVSDLRENMADLLRIAEMVDQRAPQIYVKAQIVEILLDKDFEKELNLTLSLAEEHSFLKSLIVNLDTPGSEPSTDQGSAVSLQPWVTLRGDGTVDNLTSFFRYLETRNKAKILSAPNLILRQGQEGSIITGEEVPIQEQTVVSGSISSSTEFKSVGVKLVVTPLMIAEDRIVLSIEPEVSTITSYTEATETTAANPIISVRKASTELEAKDGEVITIGGLLRDEERLIERRVPILASLPVLGHFFRSVRKQTERTHLIIMLQAEILEEGVAHGERIVRPSDQPAAFREEFERLEQEPDLQYPEPDLRRELREWGDDSIR
ncbi:type II secretion system protein GspD [Candidatus Sumerlaeota bacterium]|nr:type II secretion system protein GspD [Candidatus Sumerlaeota bacterium]